MKKKGQEYKNNLINNDLFFPGAVKGTFILPPLGCEVWERIKEKIKKILKKLNVKEVILPSFIPEDLFSKEKEHLQGFTPEFYSVKIQKEEERSNYLILRPTSEVLFSDWFRQILRSYKQLPLIFSQWGSVFRAEKSTSVFLRNREFIWQEGHSLHQEEAEAKAFIFRIILEYKKFFEKTLKIAVIAGKKSQNEKFSGALETYTIECLLPDGQCLQLATAHYLQKNFSEPFNIKFLDQKNKEKKPFYVSWGTSTRILGALTRIHCDEWGFFFPFAIAPLQLAFVLLDDSEETLGYFKKIKQIIDKRLRWRNKLFNQSKQLSTNLTEADKHGCPFKIIIGKKETNEKQVTLINSNFKKEKKNFCKNRTIICWKLKKRKKKFWNWAL